MKLSKFIRKLQDVPCISGVKIEGNTIRIYCNGKETEKMKIIDDAISEGKINKKTVKFVLEQLQGYNELYENEQKSKQENIWEMQYNMANALDEVIGVLTDLRNRISK